ncbi:AraC family transcriptional regulator [Rhodoplanes roseus]|uniref:HTH araC/xylS-type domain-containing protein n=1 Tax=Rhodoplanes roseus TaxID=29409 RepID=A0A327L6P1_9BRAD|nr:AraC family transcriptional regulator [Rhodoplanes roseus]RAI45573.1 hypothetical protein CH341_03190 [Rhodoplanes roseus]
MLLDRFTLFESNDLEQVTEFFEAIASGRLQSASVIEGPGHAFRCNGLPWTELPMFYLASRLSTSVDYAPVDYIRLVFQTLKASTLVLDGQAVESTPQSAGYIMPEGSSATEIHPDGHRSLAVRIDVPFLKRQLQALCGNEITGPVRFEQPSNSDRQFLQFLRSSVFQAALELDSLDAAFQAVLLGDLKSTLVTRLLLYGRHSHSHLLDRTSKAPNRAEMDRVEEYLSANWNKPLDLEALAAVSGVSARTILRRFHEVHGVTPRAYLRRIRLERARDMLLDRYSEETVVSIAFACGFSSLGHFAEQYLRKFGELPSATLKRRPMSPR